MPECLKCWDWPQIQHRLSHPTLLQRFPSQWTSSQKQTFKHTWTTASATLCPYRIGWCGDPQFWYRQAVRCQLSSEGLGIFSRILSHQSSGIQCFCLLRCQTPRRLCWSPLKKLCRSQQQGGPSIFLGWSLCFQSLHTGYNNSSGPASCPGEKSWRQNTAVSTLTFVCYCPTSCIPPGPLLCSCAIPWAARGPQPLVTRKKASDWHFSKVARCLYCLHADDGHSLSCACLAINQISVNNQQSSH